MPISLDKNTIFLSIGYFEWDYIKFIIPQGKEKTMEIQVIRSLNRKKTIQAKMVGQTLQVYLPMGMKPDEERKIIDK